MSPMLVLFVALSGIAVGAVAYALLLPQIALEKNADSRLKQLQGGEAAAVSRRQVRDRNQELARRRRNIQASLAAIEQKQKEFDKKRSRLPLRRRIQQAGMTLSVRAFILSSAITGLVFVVLLVVSGFPFAVALLAGAVGGFALPRWFLTYRRKQRVQKFVDEFANAIDVIVRGIRSGLPLNDTLRMVASEAQEPVRSEFQRVVEAQQLGLPTAEAVERLYENMPLSETNFFSIVIAIQSQAGGNLSEALANLSKVLRDRKKMKAKIQAMSMEAKASGAIIGSLPIIVALLIYFTNEDYIAILFQNTIGHIILAVSAVWMLIGVFVMKNMIAFDF